MTAFDALIEAQLDGRTIRYADLVRFDFKSSEKRLFSGFGPLVDGNGEQWAGIGDAGKMSAVTAGPGQAIAELTLSLFGSVELLAAIEADADEATGREVFRYLQFFDIREFDDNGHWVDWQPLGVPIQIFWGKMGPPILDRPKVDSASPASTTRIVTVKAPNAFLNRRKPSFGFFSHRDQLARTGGTDNIFINTSKMANATANWPHGLT